MKLNVEQLEAKDVPSSVTLVGGIVLADVTGTAAHVVSVSNPDANTVQVSLDGKATSFAASQVNSVVVRGSATGANIIQNNTALPAVLFGGAKGDTIFGGTGSSFIDPGAGSDVVYSIQGPTTLVANDGAQDRLITAAGANVQADAADIQQTFFAPGRTPGAGSIGFDPTSKDGALYINPTNNGSSVTVTQGKGNTTVVAFDLGDGKGPQTKTFTGVKTIAYFGGAGSDTYANLTALSETVYGSAGNDTLVGGTGDFSLIKGSGGNDTIVGRAKRNDLSGNAGADVILDMNPAAGDIARVDLFDVLFATAPLTRVAS